MSAAAPLFGKWLRYGPSIESTLLQYTETQGSEQMGYQIRMAHGQAQQIEIV